MVYHIHRTFSEFMERVIGEDRVCEPAVDIFESRDQLVIEVELPGVKKEDVELYIIRDKLYIKARRFEDKEEPGRKAYLCLERECARYYREIEIVVPCKTSQGRARLLNGILTIEFPRVEDRRGQRRDIKIE